MVDQYGTEQIPESFNDMQMETTSSVHQPEQVDTTHAYQNEAQDSNASHRVWRSPGEKKCMTETGITGNVEIASNGMVSEDRPHDETVGHVPLTSFGGAPQPSPRDNDQFIEGRINIQVIQRMKEIDAQMMALQKERMAIDRMILKLQTNKMEIDQTTLTLQTERSILFNSIINEYPNITTLVSNNPNSVALNHTIPQTFPPSTMTNIIVNRLNLSPSSEKLLSSSISDIQQLKTDIQEKSKSTTSTSNSNRQKHESSSSKERHKARRKSKSRDRSRDKSSSTNKEKPKESKDKDRKSEKKKSEKSDHQSRSQEKKSSGSIKKDETKDSTQKPRSLTLVPLPLPDAPIKKTVIANKIQTPAPKPAIEATKITIAMNTPANVQVKTTIAKMPTSIKSKVKHSFEEALSASTASKTGGKKMKDLRKEMTTEKSSEKVVEPITLKISDVRSLVPDKEDEETMAPKITSKFKQKQKLSSEHSSSTKKRRKLSNPTDESSSLTGSKKRRDRTKSPAIESEARRQIKRPGKVMKMMIPESSDLSSEDEPSSPLSPVASSEPITINDESDEISLPDEFIIPTNDVNNVDRDEEIEYSSTHQMSGLNKECKIILKKIDMHRYLKKKPVDTKVQPGLVVSLPNSPVDSDKLTAPVTIQSPDSTDLQNASTDTNQMFLDAEETFNILDENSPSEEDFEGVPDTPPWDGKFLGHDSPIVHLQVSIVK